MMASRETVALICGSHSPSRDTFLFGAHASMSALHDVTGGQG